MLEPENTKQNFGTQIFEELQNHISRSSVSTWESACTNDANATIERNGKTEEIPVKIVTWTIPYGLDGQITLSNYWSVSKLNKNMSKDIAFDALLNSIFPPRSTNAAQQPIFSRRHIELPLVCMVEFNGLSVQGEQGMTLFRLAQEQLENVRKIANKYFDLLASDPNKYGADLTWSVSHSEDEKTISHKAEKDGFIISVSKTVQQEMLGHQILKYEATISFGKYFFKPVSLSNELAKSLFENLNSKVGK